MKPWICPKCDIGVSPFTSACPNCLREARKITNYNFEPSNVSSTADLDRGNITTFKDYFNGGEYAHISKGNIESK